MAGVKAFAELEPTQAGKLPRSNLTMLRQRMKLLVGISWFVNQLAGLQRAAEPQKVYDAAEDIEAKFKAKGFGTQKAGLTSNGIPDAIRCLRKLVVRT